MKVFKSNFWGKSVSLSPIRTVREPVTTQICTFLLLT